MDDTNKELWKEYLGKIRKLWDKRDDEKLIKFNSQHERYIGILKKRYGYSHEKAASELSNNYSKVKLD